MQILYRCITRFLLIRFCMRLNICFCWLYKVLGFWNTFSSCTTDPLFDEMRIHLYCSKIHTVHGDIVQLKTWYDFDKTAIQITPNSGVGLQQLQKAFHIIRYKRNQKQNHSEQFGRKDHQPYQWQKKNNLLIWYYIIKSYYWIVGSMFLLGITRLWRG